MSAITSIPAKLFGLEDRVGSIKAGKQADLALYRSDPLGVCARPAMVWVNGKKVVG